LFWRFRDFEEFRVEFFPCWESAGIVRVHLDFLCHLDMLWK
jgi:hypothetical protein